MKNRLLALVGLWAAYTLGHRVGWGRVKPKSCQESPRVAKSRQGWLDPTDPGHAFPDRRPS